MTCTETFRTFLENKLNEEVDINTLQGTLGRTLGSDLAKIGWSNGSKGTGIVSMVDEDEADFNKSVKVINAWLKKMSFNALSKGKVSGELTTEYRGATLSIIKATGTYKVLVTK